MIPFSRHMVQLDALRALAVFAVLITHFLFRTPLSQLLPWDELGVQLFFVLSGFLITRILLQGRSWVEEGSQSAWFTLRQFYMRRFLRIFPLFYATLAVMSLAGIEPVAQTLAWHVTYLSNFYFVHIGKGHGSITHFWTLAVEEQFYLFWPFVILFVPRRWLLTVIVMTVLTGPAFRLVTGLLGINFMVRKVMLPANLDTLGMGALLALFMVESVSRPQRYRMLQKAGLWAGGPMFVAFMFLHATRSYPYGVDTLLLRSVLGLFFVWLIDSAAHGFTGVVGWTLQRPTLIGIGKISYGVYVLHNFMPQILEHLLPLGWIHPPAPWWGLRFIPLTGASLLLAAVSWRFFEKPLNDLKRHFPYRKSKALSPLADPTVEATSESGSR